MRGFHLEAADGGIGHVEEFLIDESWHVRYLVVDTSNWPGGKAVIISSSAVEKIDSPGKKIYLKLKRSEIQNSASVASADIEPIESLGFIIL
jgi:hypothetical protein